jgi:hypothetical protein
MFVYGGLRKAWENCSFQKLSTLFRGTLGERAANAEYTYFDVCNSLLALCLSGGSCPEDLQYLRKTHSKGLPFGLCSPDTVTYSLKELAVEDRVILSERSCHLFNRNDKMNRLLISTARSLGMVSKDIDLDIDGKIFECHKKDVRPTYTGTVGYQPMMAFSGRIPLYVEGRNGNTNASYRMHLTLRDLFAKLAEEQIKVGRLRIDAAGCQHKVIREVKNKCKAFFIRCSDVTHHLHGQDLHWKKAFIGDRQLEIAEAKWYSPDYKRPFRLVVERNPDLRGQTNIFTQECYIYRGIITSDSEMSPLEVIRYYNGRGTIERNFDYLGNDFNLNHLPFSSMKLNVVYMAVMAWCMIVFEYLKTTLTRKFGKNVVKWRLKRFIYQYVIQPYRIVNHARRTTVHYFSGYT